MAYQSKAQACCGKGKAYHDCLVRNPEHKVCFPLIGACDRELTIPVVHMNNPEKFKELFILAYCKGQAFGKP